MSKKDYILKVLDALTGYWPLARGLKILIDSDALDNTSIDNVVGILAKTIEKIEDIETKEKLQKSKNIIEKIKKIEGDQYISDQKTLDELNTMIKEI